MFSTCATWLGSVSSISSFGPERYQAATVATEFLFMFGGAPQGHGVSPV